MNYIIMVDKFGVAKLYEVLHYYKTKQRCDLCAEKHDDLIKVRSCHSGEMIKVCRKHYNKIYSKNEVLDIEEFKDLLKVRRDKNDKRD